VSLPQVAACRMAAGGDRGLDVVAQLRWPWVLLLLFPTAGCPHLVGDLLHGRWPSVCLAHHLNQ
jgi:hypothetical protein